MSKDQLAALLRYRMQQANETLHEAEILFNQLAYRGTINRAYYAMFYSVLALLATKKLGTSKHSGIIGLFDREFVKTGLFPRDLSRSLRLAFDRRQTYDCIFPPVVWLCSFLQSFSNSSNLSELNKIDEQIAQETLNDAKVFISTVGLYLQSTGHL